MDKKTVKVSRETYDAAAAPGKKFSLFFFDCVLSDPNSIILVRKEISTTLEGSHAPWSRWKED